MLAFQVITSSIFWATSSKCLHCPNLYISALSATIFIQSFQAACFYVPHWIWKQLEGGRLQNIVQGLNEVPLSNLAPKLHWNICQNLYADQNKLIVINWLHLSWLLPWIPNGALIMMVEQTKVIAGCATATATACGRPTWWRRSATKTGWSNGIIKFSLRPFGPPWKFFIFWRGKWSLLAGQCHFRLASLTDFETPPQSWFHPSGETISGVHERPAE